MIATAHSDCLTCCYWQDRIGEEKQRALAARPNAYAEEKRVRRELAEHRARTHQPAVTSLSRRVTR